MNWIRLIGGVMLVGGAAVAGAGIIELRRRGRVPTARVDPSGDYCERNLERAEASAKTSYRLNRQCEARAAELEKDLYRARQGEATNRRLAREYHELYLAKTRDWLKAVKR